MVCIRRHKKIKKRQSCMIGANFLHSFDFIFWENVNNNKWNVNTGLFKLKINMSSAQMASLWCFTLYLPCGTCYDCWRAQGELEITYFAALSFVWITVHSRSSTELSSTFILKMASQKRAAEISVFNIWRGWNPKKVSTINVGKIFRYRIGSCSKMKKQGENT